MVCWDWRGKTWVLHHILIEFNLDHIYIYIKREREREREREDFSLIGTYIKKKKKKKEEDILCYKDLPHRIHIFTLNTIGWNKEMIEVWKICISTFYEGPRIDPSLLWIILIYKGSHEHMNNYIFFVWLWLFIKKC